MSKKKESSILNDSAVQGLADVISLQGGFGGAPLSQTDSIHYNNKYYLISADRMALTYLYVNNGIVQAFIDQPVEDAFRDGFNIISDILDEDDIKEIQSYIESNGILANYVQARKWARLYGGGGLIINCGQKADAELKINVINENTPLEFYDADLWELSDYSTRTNNQFDKPTLDIPYNYYGVRLHRSKVLRIMGKKAPSFVRPKLRGWGMSDIESIIRSLNQNQKIQNLIFQLLDEAKIDVYKLKGYNDALAMPNGSGVAKINTAVQASNQIKNFMSALLIDAEDDYQQKQITLTGIAEIFKEIRIQLAADLRRPMTKLFGISSSGFNAGDDDLENYNSMVEGSERTPAKQDLIEIVNIVSQKLFGGFADDIRIEYEPLRMLTHEQEENVKNQKQNRMLNLYDRQLMTSEEIISAHNNEALIGDITLEDKEVESQDEDQETLNNSKKKDKIEWITVRGNHIPIKEGETKKEAIDRFLEKVEKKKSEKKKSSDGSKLSDILGKVEEDNKRDIRSIDVIKTVVKNLGYSKKQIVEKIYFADKYNEKVRETHKIYKDSETELYSAKRTALHKEIINKLLKNADNAKPPKGEKPNFIMLGGRGGSGKSKFNGMVYDKDNYIVLDADAIKEMLPEYKGYNAFEVHEESSDILKDALMRAKQKGLNVVLDATMKTEKSSAKILENFIEDSYNIEMYYMHLPREIAMERAIGRYMGKNGRYVPLKILADMKNNEFVFDKLKKYADKWGFYDNNVKSKSEPPKLVAEG